MKFQEILNESGLSRVWSHSKKHDVGTITAFRSARDCNKGEAFSKKENMKNNNILKSKLLKLGYGVTAIDGVYIEDYKGKNPKNVKEKSFLVVDLKDNGNLQKDLVKLGSEFEQDSVTFQDQKSGTYYLISSNKCPEGYPGNGKIGVKIKLGKPLFGKDGEFHSKINGRPFVFESESIKENLTVLNEMFPTSIRGVVASSKEDIIK